MAEPAFQEFSLSLLFEVAKIKTVMSPVVMLAEEMCIKDLELRGKRAERNETINVSKSSGYAEQDPYPNSEQQGSS